MTALGNFQNFYIFFSVGCMYLDRPITSLCAGIVQVGPLNTPVKGGVIFLKGPNL